MTGLEDVINVMCENKVAETVITLFCVMVAGNTIGSLCYGYLYQRAKDSGNR